MPIPSLGAAPFAVGLWSTEGLKVATFPAPLFSGDAPGNFLRGTGGGALRARGAERDIGRDMGLAERLTWPSHPVVKR